jgi:hypothetical protein
MLRFKDQQFIFTIKSLLCIPKVTPHNVKLYLIGAKPFLYDAKLLLMAFPCFVNF